MSEGLAYIAGFLDADGCVCIAKFLNRGYLRYCMKVQITNTDRNVLEWVQKFFGCGNLHGIKRKTWAEYFTLEWSPDDAVRVLSQLLPYLKVKKNQALLALDFQSRLMKQEFPKKYGIPDDLKEERDSVMYQIKKLNGGNDARL